jgi:hypothetical protein
VEEHGQLAVVDGHLGEGGDERPEPEGEPGTVVGDLAAAQVADVRGRCRAQVPQRSPKRLLMSATKAPLSSGRR